MANKTVQTAKWMSTAAVIACTVAFTPTWEGIDYVAKRDMIGTGHPITYCNGLTSVDGSVKIGQRFTKAQCDEALAIALPKYLAQIEPCFHRQVPDKVASAFLDGAFNAGPGAVCRSPMMAKANAGDLRGACNAFEGWYVRSDGQVRKGLIARRDGEDHGDHRLSEKGLCLQGVREGTKSNSGTVVAHLLNSGDSVATETTEIKPAVDETAAPKTIFHRPHKKVAPPPEQRSWWTSWVFR